MVCRSEFGRRSVVAGCGGDELCIWEMVSSESVGDDYSWGVNGAGVV